MRSRVDRSPRRKRPPCTASTTRGCHAVTANPSLRLSRTASVAAMNWPPEADKASTRIEFTGIGPSTWGRCDHVLQSSLSAPVGESRALLPRSWLRTPSVALRPHHPAPPRQQQQQQHLALRTCPGLKLAASRTTPLAPSILRSKFSLFSTYCELLKY